MSLPHDAEKTLNAKWKNGASVTSQPAVAATRMVIIIY